MDYITIEQTLRKIKYLFVLGGMKLHEKRAPGTSPIRYRATYVFSFIWFNLACLSALSFLVMGILHGTNFTELSFVAPCLAFSYLGIAKSLCYTLHDKEAYQLIEDLVKLEVSRNDSISYDNVRKIKVSETNFLRRVLNVLNILYILLMTLYNASPLVGSAVTYYLTGKLKLFLPILDVYPFDALDLRYWPYAYIHQIWSVCVVLFYVGSVDCFLLTCCTYIRIQFRLVQLDAENIIPVKNIISGPVRGDVQFQNKFKELVCRHQEIIRLANSLQNIFSTSILFNVITSSMLICLTGFNVTVIKEWTLVLPSVAFLVTSLLQVLCLCYFGDQLMSSSAEVSDAVYASRWYLADKGIAKKLLFILTRAQVPCILTASGFMEVNLSAFMKILSTSWSYFALLRTMYTQ